MAQGFTITMLRAALLFIALAVASAQAPVNGDLGAWSGVINLPLIPVAAALREDGRVLMWSAFTPNVFDRQSNRFVASGGGMGLTKHAVYNPPSGFIRAYEVSNTGHDMFCPGISILFNGDFVISGGQNSDKTSIYDRSINNWTPGGDLGTSRGYGSSVTLASGEVFVIGGSWSGVRQQPKGAEIYNPNTNSWRPVPQIDEKVIYTNDPQGQYRADNYAWNFAWRGNSVFHAGPSTAMHWFFTDGDSPRDEFAGTRPGDDAHNGCAVMFDARRGKILTAGGSPAFARPEFGSRSDSALITINVQVGTEVQVEAVGDLNIARVYGNAVALPDGRVAMVGGAAVPKEFDDETAIFSPEIWDQETESWTLIVAQHSVPRTYHSTAILLQDGRVFHGGGGLCNCAADHLNAEIFSPPYLFNANGSPASRPSISLNKATVGLSGTITVTSNVPLMMISAVRYGSATHSTNTDQRRVELCGPNWFDCGASPATVKIPDSSGVVIRGNWMIFGIGANGTPSVAQNLLIT